MPKICPFLWFDNNAEEAVAFYLSVFGGSRLRVGRNTEGTPGSTGSVLVITFELDGQEFLALNGGPNHPFTDAISLMVYCKDQAEIDDYWEKLTQDGGKPIQCGWLQDKFGVCWQIVPENVADIVENPKAMKALMGMVKLDMATLQNPPD